MKSKLLDIATVQAGYSFRSKIEQHEHGVPVIQMKDICPRDGIIWAQIIKTALPGRPPSNWIENGNLLFLSKGNNNFSIYIEGVEEDTVSTPHFFQIKVTDDTVLPEFLSWQLNQAPAQRYFDKSAEGATSRHIRKNVLESLTIVIPSIEQQQEIIRLDKLFSDEARSFEQLANNRQHIMNAIAEDLNSTNEGVSS